MECVTPTYSKKEPQRLLFLATFTLRYSSVDRTSTFPTFAPLKGTLKYTVESVCVHEQSVTSKGIFGTASLLVTTSCLQLWQKSNCGSVIEQKYRCSQVKNDLLQQKAKSRQRQNLLPAAWRLVVMVTREPSCCFHDKSELRVVTLSNTIY